MCKRGSSLPARDFRAAMTHTVYIYMHILFILTGGTVRTHCSSASKEKSPGLINYIACPTAPGPAPLSNFRTDCGPQVKKFAHPCSRWIKPWSPKALEPWSPGALKPCVQEKTQSAMTLHYFIPIKCLCIKLHFVLQQKRFTHTITRPVVHRVLWRAACCFSFSPSESLLMNWSE